MEYIIIEQTMFSPYKPKDLNGRWRLSKIEDIKYLLFLFINGKSFKLFFIKKLGLFQIFKNNSSLLENN